MTCSSSFGTSSLAPAGPPAGLGSVRSCRTSVMREIDKLEKLLEEAELIFGRHATSLARAS